ncbi:MAG TPA: alpha/beta fold hydrolase [Thermoplasmata archaeon]|nr:alpha/beta fold hydrolase [Thermoplasmata archaeon]
MTLTESKVKLADGRQVMVLEAGEPSGLPVFVLHGSPGARLLYEPHIRDAARKGIRLIGHDRAGYGGSTPQRGRRVLDEADDVGAIANHLGLERFGVWGYSGGGALALACAARHPRRVIGASSIAGVAPYPGEGFDWTAGMGASNVEDFRLLLADPVRWEAQNEQEAQALATVNEEGLRRRFATLLSATDRMRFQGELLAYFTRLFVEGVRAGGAGLRDDSLSQCRPWGFDLGSIRVPTQVWHGGQDHFVPFSHGEYLVRNIPGVEPHLDPAEGHLTLFDHAVPQVHDWLGSRRP